MVSAVVAIPDPRCGTAPAHRYSVGSATNAEMNWALRKSESERRCFSRRVLDQAAGETEHATNNQHMPSSTTTRGAWHRY